VAKYRKSFTNPHLYRQFSNNASEMFDYTMTNIMDGFYDEAMDSSIDDVFKAVCLSGIASESNTGEGTGRNDAVISGPFINLIVRPLSDFGNIIPDPRSSKDPNKINALISLHASTFTARSDEGFDITRGIDFGQVIDCYFEKGSIVNSDFRSLRFSQPKGKVIETSFQDLSLIAGVKAVSVFDWSGASLLGGPMPETNRYAPCNKVTNVLLLQQAMDEFGVTNIYARVAILSVIKKESGLCPQGEKMKYTPGRLAEVWSRFSTTGRTVEKGLGKDYANALAYEYAGDPVKLANLVYNTGRNPDRRYGNRGDVPSDGWNFRGRGFNQITFRGTYEKYAQRLGVDLLNDPDLLNEPSVAARAAVIFIQNRWKSKKNLGANPQFSDQKTANLWAARANAGWGKGMESSPVQRAIKNTNEASRYFQVQADGKIILI
tara:strand:+ start:223 stop:1521 length:1299 start_codon:yes stop_codon:yes gene_type:complete